MKKILAIISLLFVASPAFAAMSITPSTYSTPDTVLNFTTDSGNDSFFIYSSTAIAGNWLNQGFSAPISQFVSGGYIAFGDTFEVVDDPLGSGVDCYGAIAPTAADCAAITGGTISVVSFVAPPPTGFFDSSVIMASVVSSVQETGSLLWPLFVFMGILIAFYIAMKVGDFVRYSIGRSRATRATRTEPYEEEYTAEQRGRIVNKIKELGDRDSFDE